MSGRYSASQKRFDWLGFAVVLLLHVGALAFLYQHRWVPVPRSLEPLFVHFITPEPPPKPAEVMRPRVQRKPRPIDLTPPPPQIVVEAPALLPAEPVAPPPPPPPAPEPVVAAAPTPPAPAVPKSMGPVTLSQELSLSCPERAPPPYPAQSRRLKEQGQVLLRVELDEHGRVDAARIEKPSGAQRLDEAALAAVRHWRCNPARRDGQPVRAIALQPFNFVLE